MATSPVVLTIKLPIMCSQISSICVNNPIKSKGKYCAQRRIAKDDGSLYRRSAELNTNRPRTLKHLNVLRFSYCLLE